jgi:hypothetical protein
MKGYDDFFVVKKENRFDFLDLKFLAKAISTDKDRFSLTFVFCEKEDDHLVMVATDGRRMHLLRPSNADLYGAKEGYYKILSNNEKEIIFAHCDESGVIDHGQFPNYRKVIPDGEIRDTIEDCCFSKKDNRSIVSFAKKMDEDLTMNIKYLYDLAPFLWTVNFYSGTMRAINFISTNKQAVIMPMNE